MTHENVGKWVVAVRSIGAYHDIIQRKVVFGEVTRWGEDTFSIANGSSFRENFCKYKIFDTRLEAIDAAITLRDDCGETLATSFLMKARAAGAEHDRAVSAATKDWCGRK